MDIYLYIIFSAIGFGASVIGAICGIGGGILIKPILDAFGVLSVVHINFLSGCTVLSMTCYSVIKARRSKESLIDKKIGTPLALGAAFGGILGKTLFQIISGLFANKNQVGAVQALCLLVITLGTLLYTIKKDKIKTLHTTNTCICALTGFALGIFSSFLGIGGGPVNLVVLFHLFSMDTKTAAQNSLYIILFSQITSLLNTVISRSVPEFEPAILILMVSGGILGGICGRIINKKISSHTVNNLFIIIMLLIIFICGYNIYRFI